MAPRSFQHGGRRGQVMIVMIAVLVILLLVTLWNFDLHKILFVKARSRNAGDAAALAAARWQATSLNLIGSLNVLQAVALTEALSRGETNSEAAEAIADLQSRIAFVGPMTGFAASQQAAKNNGLHVNDAFSGEVLAHAAEVREEYPIRYPDPPYVNDPPTPSCWDDYASMIEFVALEGIAAAPDNARYFSDYANHDHFLLTPDFYDAVATRGWCWFFFNAMDLLENYDSWRDWPPLPVFDELEPVNSEYFGLSLRKVATLDALPGSAAATAGLLDALGEAAGEGIAAEATAVSAQWFAYRESDWASWSSRLPPGFPFLADIRPLHDYGGADSAVRTESEMRRLSPGADSDTIVWSAAAKPFGYLEHDGARERPDRFTLVLPAFRDVRLIPVDASTAPGGGSRPGWGIHIHVHLPEYMERGLDGLVPGCWYCDQLRTWEEDEFREAGIAWLRTSSDRCRVRGGPGGSSPGGGTRRGH